MLYKMLYYLLLCFELVLAKKRFYYFYDSDDKAIFDKYRNKEFLNFGKFSGVILDDEEYQHDNKLKSYKYIEDQEIKIIDYGIESLITKSDSGIDLWGLDRINQYTGDLDDKIHNQNTGNNIEVYVIDSGIETSHYELNHNSKMIKDYTNDNDNIDYNGHGTHVSGIIGGLKYGISRNTKIYGLKVFDSSGSGSTMNIILAMYEVMKRCLHKNNKKCIINMSLGGPYQQIYNDIINDMMLHNIIVVVAAGNDNRDACAYTPAAAYLSVTVGATNVKDERAVFSNYGNCVNIYAPGQKIYSSYKKGTYRYLSGTSMATPIVTGILSHIWSNNRGLNSFEIVDLLYKKSNTMLIKYFKNDNLRKESILVENYEKFSYIKDEGYNWYKKINILEYIVGINIVLTTMILYKVMILV